MKTSSRARPMLFQQLVQQLPGATDEGQALSVLFGPRRLADEHQLGVGVAGPEHRLGPGLVQWAPGAGLDVPEEADELEAARLGGDVTHLGGGPFFFAGVGASPAARFFLSAASRSRWPDSRSRRLDSSDRTAAPRGCRPGGETGDISRRTRVDPQLGQATSAVSPGRSSSNRVPHSSHSNS